MSSSLSVRFSVMSHRCFPFAVETTMTTARDYNRNARDSRRQRTSPADEPASPMPVSDQRADNEFRPETLAASAGTKEMKLAVLSWEQMDIFLPHGDASGEDDC